jgi:hypothetical protein
MMKFPISWESHKIPWFQTTNQSNVDPISLDFQFKTCRPWRMAGESSIFADDKANVPKHVVLVKPLV